MVPLLDDSCYMRSTVPSAMSCWHSEESNQLAGGMSSCVYKMHEFLDAHVVRHVTGHVRFVPVDCTGCRVSRDGDHGLVPMDVHAVLACSRVLCAAMSRRWGLDGGRLHLFGYT